MMVTIDTEQIERATAILREIPGGVEKAQSRAINRALAATRTQVVKSIREEYNVKTRDVRETIKIHKATPTNPAGSVTSTGSMIPLIKFGPRPSTPGTGGPGRPDLRVSVKKGESKTNPGAFVARMKSGALGVYRRKTAKRHPIEQLYGPAIPIMAGAADVAMEIEEKAQAIVGQRFEHEVTRLLEAAA